MKEKIRNLISQNKTKEAIQLFNSILEEGDMKNNLRVITKKFSKLSTDEMLGTISGDEARRVSAQVDIALLNLVSELAGKDTSSSYREENNINVNGDGNIVVDRVSGSVINIGGRSTNPSPSKAVGSSKPKHFEKAFDKQNITIFVSYSSRDRKLRAILEKYLTTHLQSSKYQYNTWTDVALTVNDDWNTEIQGALNTSHLGILLVSPAFLGSKYAMGEELQNMLARRANENYVIVPILLRKCRFYNNEALKKMQFFKTYQDEYDITDLLEIDDLMPFENLADIDKPSQRHLNTYFEKLAEQIDKAVEKAMKK